MKRISTHVSYANVVATLALFLALSGGAAYAASHYLITSAKQIKPSVLAQLKGKTGPAGANGAQGAQGPAGAGGAQGPAGPAGPQGPGGSQGPAGPAGPAGANGKNGETGFTSTLPSGKTETGTWSFAVGINEHDQRHVFVPISFSIPLQGSAAPGAPVIEEADVHYFARGESGTPGGGCGKGTAEKPEAEQGNLCVYTAEASPTGLLPTEAHIVDPALSGQSGAGATGADLRFFFEFVNEEPLGLVFFEGTWAVTAP